MEQVRCDLSTNEPRGTSDSRNRANTTAATGRPRDHQHAMQAPDLSWRRRGIFLPNVRLTTIGDAAHFSVRDALLRVFDAASRVDHKKSDDSALTQIERLAPSDTWRQVRPIGQFGGFGLQGMTHEVR